MERSLHGAEKSAAYDYLCRLDEARRWIEGIISEDLPPVTKFEDVMSNGVYLCKLGMKLLPNNPEWKKVYDLDQTKFRERGLDFRHTDNINFFLNCLPKLGLPKVFYPCVTDIFEKKNPMKLTYCLHALCHLLKQQGKIDMNLSDAAVTNGSLKFTDYELKSANQTLRNGEGVPSFEVIDRLVQEELQYTNIEIYNEQVVEEEPPQQSSPTIPTPKSPATDDDKSDDDDDLFDDPKYIQMAGGTVVAQPSSPVVELAPLLQNLKCHGVGIVATLYPCASDRTSTGSDEFNKSLYSINCCVEAGSPLETLRSLQKPAGNLPFPYLEAEDYQLALEQEKKEGFPQKTIVVYSGLQRQLCDSLLDKMRPGAYLLRESTTLSDRDFVFSFRNEVGIKHWKLNVSEDGKFTWGKGNKLFSNLESFIQYFVSALAKVTKLYIYPGTAFLLQLSQSSLTSEQHKTLQSLKTPPNLLTYGQLVYVINDVNSRIRKQRATTKEKEQASGSSKASPAVTRRESKCKTEQGSIPNPLTKVNLELIDDDPWSDSLLFCISRSKAEDLLDTEGYPGSFLVRPSEKVLGDYALAFRTRNEIRHWKIVKSNHKYYVHPRPHSYRSVADIVQHFRDAVGAETGLVMSPLRPQSPLPVERKNSVDNSDIHVHVLDDRSATPPPPPLPRKPDYRQSETMSVLPTPSLSRLNPANITSWSTDDVATWLCQQGLGQFSPIFIENCVDGECLLTLDNNLLKDDLGITQLGYRSRIMKRVLSLKAILHPEL